MEKKIRYGFLHLLLLTIFAVCSTLTMSAQTKVTSLSQLKAGSVIRIYPKDREGSHYGESEFALACSGNGCGLTKFYRAYGGDRWTLVDAGDGYYYLRNNLGYYWAYQGSSSTDAMTCTTSQSSAVKVSLTWDSKDGGVCFWNQKDGAALNNLLGANLWFNWYMHDTPYDNDVFDVALVAEKINGIYYQINQQSKTATVFPNDYSGYSGDIVIPKRVTYDGNNYIVTSLSDGCFSDCSGLTSITLPNSITSLGNWCFSGCSGLTSITLPNSITSLGDWCFYNCSGLTRVSIPDGVKLLNYRCFNGCTGLKELSLPASLKEIGENVWNGIKNNIVISCLTLTPPENSTRDFIDSNYRLFVPRESLEKYKSTSPWSNAYSINPLYPTSSIVLPAEVSVTKTNTMTLNYTLLPENAGTKSVTWSCENPDIASVDAAGVITGKKIGTTKITATATDGTDVSASTTVTVLPLPVETITFSNQKLSITRTENAIVSIMVNPVDADYKSVTWTSDNESVATIAQSADVTKPFEAIVIGKKVGKAIIKAEVQDGSGMSATCEVEVTPLMVSDFAAKTISVVKTIPTKMEMEFTPVEADNKNLKWTSLTPDIATVTEDGTITGQKVGTAKLKAETTDGSSIEKTFEVKVAPLLVNAITLPSHLDMMTLDTKTLTCSVLPEAADNKKLTWNSNAPSIASVDAGGKVTALKTGKAVITAAATDGSGVSASCSVTITNPAADNLSFDCDVNNHTAKLQKTTYAGDVIVPEYVEYLGQQYRITSFADDCFADCPDLKSITFLSATPLDVTEKALEPLSTDKVKVYVSAEAYETYFAADYWKSSSLYTIGEDDSQAVVVLKGVRYQLRKGKEEGYRATVFPDTYTGKVDVPQTVMYRYSQYVPDSIAPNAFAQTNGVALTIPVTVQKYGRDAFKGSTDFSFDYQGDISYWLFARFENGEANPISASGKLIINGKEINRVNVPVNCKDMLPYTFYGCTSLDSLKLNVVMNSIAEGCFVNCGELKYVYCEPTTPPLLAEGAFAGTTIAELRVPSTHYDIYCKAPVYGEAQNIYTLTDDVNTDLVGFHSDGMIFTVDRGKHTASITRSTMLAGGSDKTYEGNITIPGNVVYNKEAYPLEAIDDECFNGCQALEKLVIPASIKKIGGNAFSLNTKMSFDYLGTLESWMKIEFADASSNPVGETGHLVIQGKDLGTSLTIPSSITEVLPYTFVGCKTIEELEVGKHVEKFDGSAFTLCSNIKTLKYFGPSLNKTINPFNGSDGDKPCPITHLETSDNALAMTASAYASTLEEVVLDDDYDGSSNYLGFANCKKLRSVQLGRNVTVIGGPLGGAFENCSALEEITLPEAVTTINANAFKGCTLLKKLYFGGELYNSTIGKDAFYDCKNLELVDFNGDIVDWSGMEFENKYANPMYYAKKVLIDGNELEELQLPEGCGINSFNSYAFVNLKSLKRVIAGAEMGVFPYSVFEGCSNLEEIQLHLQGAPATAMRGSFDGVDKSTCVLRVPADQIAAYKRQYIWKDFLNIEAFPVYVENIYFAEVPHDMTVGEKQTLHIVIEPANAENKDIEWLSSDDAIATVDEQGVVTAIAEGTVYITAAAKDASGVSARCVINVSEPTGIGYINMGDIKFIINKRHLTVAGLAKDDVIQVINMNGLTVYMGTKHEIDLDAEGVYIIKVKGKALKFRAK